VKKPIKHKHITPVFFYTLDGMVMLGLDDGIFDCSVGILPDVVTKLVYGDFYPYQLGCVYPQTLKDQINDVYRVRIKEVQNSE
jgi:hypothetical protein